MQVIFLPRATCDKLDGICRNFLWGDTEDSKRIHLVKWAAVCKPKSMGGLGIRSARQANDALLTKLGWRMLTQQHTLWAQTLLKKYMKHSNSHQQIVPQQKQSVIWVGITKVAHLIQAGAKKTIGDGKLTKFWLDDWIPSSVSLWEAGIRAPPGQEDKLVSDYRLNGQGWDWAQLCSTVPSDWWLKIEAVFVDEEGELEDSLMWKFNSNGEFSTKSAYLWSLGLCGQPIDEDKGWKQIWRIKTQERVRMFLWLCKHGRIMTNQERVRRQFFTNPSCQACQNRCESLIHVLRDCPRAKKVWWNLVPSEYRNLFFSMSTQNWLDMNAGIERIVQPGSPWNAIFATTIWWLWKWRNGEVFRSDHFQGDKKTFIIKQSQEYMEAWKSISRIPSIQQQPSRRSNSWQKPPVDWIKLNTDGSSKGNPGPATGAGVFRDDNGNWLLGYVQRVGICNAVTAEMWAIWRGLWLACQKRYPKLVVESDSQLAVRYLTEGIARDNSLSSLVISCQELIRRFERVELMFCNRECNRLADRLTHLAVEVRGVCHVLDRPPDCCICLLDEERLAVSACISSFNES